MRNAKVAGSFNTWVLTLSMCLKMNTSRFSEVAYLIVAVRLLNKIHLGPHGIGVSGKCIPETTTDSGPMYGTVETAVVVSSELAASFQETVDHQHQQLVDYLRVLFAAVNLNLRNTQTDILDLMVVVTDIVVLTEYSELPYKRHPRNRNLTEASSAALLVSFMKQHLHIFSGIDAALYLSNNLFARTLQGTNRYQTLKGVAYTGGACGMLGCGIVYVDSDVVSSCSTITHEILHIIGSGHDGKAAQDYLTNSPGALNCPDDPKYIMAEYFQPEAESYLPLSTCTRDQVKAFLNITPTRTTFKSAF
ncbi:venom metalloproteinase antarease-like TpachMP_B isoform X2 [Dermacentor albipictus]|uniref:venom metalloproteinase antarease-like TpachMP_B isoform X2 n=1 Tax=Dermacentor albipictus TaxID=60249 RepID=UPI0038FCDF0D